jgi:hypothetical protein
MLVIHGAYDEGSGYGFGGADDGLTVRFSTFVGNGQGIALGLTDPSEHVNAGDMTVEHNTVVDASGSTFSIQSTYPGAGVRVTGNVFRMSTELGPAEGDPKLYDLWVYDDAPPEAELESDLNCFYAPNDDQGFRVGPDSVGYAGWTARGHDEASAFGDPGFPGGGDYHLAPSSPCRLPGGLAGAWLDP